MSKNLDYRLFFGFGILIIVAILAIVIALGKVEESTSHGLNIVLGTLSTLAGNFATWAFSRSPVEPKKEE